MPTPTFTLTGTEQQIDGTPHVGSVLIVPNAVVRDAAGDVVLSGPVEVPLDASGHWSIDLPADDPSLDPATGLGYTIKYRLQSAVRAAQTLAAKATGTTFDASDLVGPDVLNPITTAVGPGVPAGGTTGQALVKATDTDYDTEWSSVSGVGGGAVDSVNGQTGVVVLGAADVGAQPAGSYATAAQGALADTAVQPADLSTVATTGVYSDLTGKPTLGTAAATASTDYATAAQGAKADTASQPGHTHTASQISDSTTTGRALLTAADAAAARTAIGAGTSSLALGTTGTTAAAGNDSRLSDSRTPSGSAGGDLSGTYPSPTVAKINGVTVTGTPASGKVITATSGTAATWQAPAAGGSGVAPAILPPVGYFVGPYLPSGSNATRTVGSSGQLVPTPIFIFSAITVDQIACQVDTAEAGKNIKILLYAPDANNLAGSLVIDSGALSAATTGNVIATLGTPVALPAGLYWGFVITDGTTVAVTCTTSPPFQGVIGSFNQLRSFASTGNPKFDVGTYASPAATATVATNTSWGGTNNPIIGLRRSA